MVKYDPHNHKRYYERWKEGGSSLPEISPQNATIIRRYLEDMEIGANVSPSTKKGSRSYGLLRNLKAKLQTLFMLMEEELGIECVTELYNRDMDILKFFRKFREGQLRCRRIRCKPLKAIGTYARVFKAFWHWYQREQRKKGETLLDITVDLDSRDDKPKFNYFTIEQLKELCNSARYDYRVMMMFLFDSGIRAPTEMMNIRVKDLEWDDKRNHYILNIREETSKTFGRKIKLLLCSDMLKDYITQQKFPVDQFIFKKSPQNVN